MIKLCHVQFLMLALQEQVTGLEMANQAGRDEPANPSTQMD